MDTSQRPGQCITPTYISCVRSLGEENVGEWLFQEKDAGPEAA